MQIVIDIDEEIYNNFMNDWVNSPDILHAVRRGTPLPEHYGRLIILSETKIKENQIQLDFSSQNWISEVGLSNATVATIEADGGDSE